MSKLFDALKRLEQGSDKRLDIPVFFASEEKPGKKVLPKSPWLIPLVCVAALCALGFLSLFWVEKMLEKGSAQPQFAQNRQKIHEELRSAQLEPSLPPASPEVQSKTNVNPAETPAVVPVKQAGVQNKVDQAQPNVLSQNGLDKEKIPSTSQVNNSQKIEVTSETSEQAVERGIIGVAATPMSRNVKHEEATANAPEISELPEVTHVRKAPVVVVSQVGPSEAESARFRKGLLSQAELMRQHGKLDEAATIYKQIWKETGRVEVANNLAATLMLAGREAEAVLILEEALKKAPSDEDLRYNLDVCNERIAAKKGL